jgi:hypothetical protein
MTDHKSTNEFMAALQAQVSAQDAAQDAVLASIMEGKHVVRPRKVHPEGDGTGAPAKKAAPKPRRKKAAGKTQS